MPKNPNFQDLLNSKNYWALQNIPNPSVTDTRRLYYRHKYMSELNENNNLGPDVSDIIEWCKNGADHIIQSNQSLAHEFENYYYELLARKTQVEYQLSSSVLSWKQMQSLITSQKEILSLQKDAESQLENPFFPEAKKEVLYSIIAESEEIKNIIKKLFNINEKEQL